MLLELKVSQFAIISHLHVHFREGLNILSGETGAGKSVLLRSLALLMGDKAATDTVRSGAEHATIEGYFDLSRRPDLLKALRELGLAADDDVLVVRRVINPQGKSKVYLNGHLSALSNLRDIVAPLITVTGHPAPLIEMTGQHDNRHLQSKAYHLDILDHYVGAMGLRQEFLGNFEALKSIHEEMDELREQSRQREQRLDFLFYQRDEIRAVNPQPGEDEALASQITRLRHAARLSEFVSLAQASLYADEDSVAVRMHQILQRANELKSYDESLASRLEPLLQAKTLVEEAVYDLRDYSRSLGGESEDLNQLEERLSALRKLQKKFGGSVEEILSSLEKIEAEIGKLESADDTLKELSLRASGLEQQLQEMASELHVRRSQGAELLARTVNDELVDLNMKGVQFGVAVGRLEALNSLGCSDVEFTIRSSKKDEPRPLAKVASGGELSRILLALKRVVGHGDLPRTYLFDEVDTGVSGETAQKVGRKLKSIAQGQQVICVTHLPQVAAFADAHFAIEKGSGRAGVEMKLHELNKSDRVQEIARLISGEKITATSIEHAKELLSH